MPPPTRWRSEWQPKRVAAEQDDVGGEDERADADAEVAPSHQQAACQAS